MTPSPIRKVLSTFRRHGVQTLLMGGQACVFYGAAQVSKDIDLARKPKGPVGDGLTAAEAGTETET